MGGFPFAVFVLADFELLALAVVAGVADQDEDVGAVDAGGEAFAVGEIAGPESHGHDRTFRRRRGRGVPTRAPLFFFFGLGYRHTLRQRRRLLGLLAALAEHVSDFGDSLSRQHAEPPFFFAEIRSFFEEPFLVVDVRLHGF